MPWAGGRRDQVLGVVGRVLPYAEPPEFTGQFTALKMRVLHTGQPRGPKGMLTRSCAAVVINACGRNHGMEVGRDQARSTAGEHGVDGALVARPTTGGADSDAILFRRRQDGRPREMTPVTARVRDRGQA